MIKIAPSILSADFSNLQEEIIKIDQAGADYIHIDIMDGHYVPNISFGSGMIQSIRPHSKKEFDVHLMIQNVDNFIKDFVSAGADNISFHPETSKDPVQTINFIKSLNCKAGLAIHPDIEVSLIKNYIHLVDRIIVMTVVPGFGGQKFIKSQISKIFDLNEIKKKQDLKFEIEVDGGIDIITSKICIDKGANVLVAGSYIFNSKKNDYKKLIDTLR